MCHASDIGLIRNLKTRSISPQLHVVYDDFYTTVAAVERNEVPETWKLLYDNSRKHLIDPNKVREVPPLDNLGLNDQEIQRQEQQQRVLF